MRRPKQLNISQPTTEFDMTNKGKRPTGIKPDGRPQVNERNLPPMQIKVPMPAVKPTKKD